MVCILCKIGIVEPNETVVHHFGGKRNRVKGLYKKLSTENGRKRRDN
jgi:hypothetical protein